MPPAPAGIARDSCPFCGERPGLGWWHYIGGRGGTPVACKACGKTSLVSPEATVFGLLAALLVSGAFTVGLIKYLGVWLTVVAAMAVFPFVKGQVTRRLARLDPPDSI